MVRRTAPAVATILATIAILLFAMPVAAYNNVNHYHLRLTRLDPIACGTPIRIRATLTDKFGHAASGKSVHFEITKGGPGDVLSPEYVTTDSEGNATTVVTLSCRGGDHDVKVKATGPNQAKARIWLEHRDNDGHHGDDWWRGERDTTAALTATTGTPGDGTGSHDRGGASGLGSSSALAPVGPAALGALIVWAVYRRRSTLRIARPAST